MRIQLVLRVVFGQNERPEELHQPYLLAFSSPTISDPVRGESASFSARLTLFITAFRRIESGCHGVFLRTFLTCSASPESRS